MRKTVIAGNWKMHKTIAEATQFMTAMKDLVIGDNVDVIICAPYLQLPALVAEATNENLHIAAQNMHFEKEGAFTGEVSPVMLADLGVTHVVIGHSERRQYFAETDETVNGKAIAAFENNLIPIVCVGESLAEYENNDTLEVIEKQVKTALQNISAENIARTIIAYEPVWAIGTGKTATSKEADAVCGHIRQIIANLTTAEIAEAVIIQYGGSVNAGNIDELLQTEHIDGALVGGASLAVDSFKVLIEAGNTKS